MTMQASETISCPACGHPQEFLVCRTLNATLDPQLKEQLLAGELTAFTCGRCGQRAEVSYSLLYHDMVGQFMVWLVPGDDCPEPLDSDLFGSLGKDYRYRLVRSRKELVEKLLVFGDGLDDRVVEVCKLFLRHGEGAVARDAGGTVYYDGSSPEAPGGPQLRFVLTGVAEPVSVGLQPGAYEDLRSRLATVLSDADEAPGQWREVNEGYALGMLEALAGGHEGSG